MYLPKTYTIGQTVVYKFLVTNCFPTPRPELHLDADDATQAREQSYDEKQSETIDMLRRFR
jgi:hypothetical protein